jgi:hypothetical protein
MTKPLSNTTRIKAMDCGRQSSRCRHRNPS